jgi:hypothetical protein
VRKPRTTEVCSGKAHGGCAKEAAATVVEILGHLGLLDEEQLVTVIYR